MKCVIFGGGGFIGSAIADHLLLNGYSVRIFERPRVEPYRAFADSEKIEWCTGDFLSSHDLASAIDGVDVVLHLISTTLPKSSNDDPIYDVQSNLLGSLQLLNAMVNQKVSKIIFISSGGTVYGIPKYLPIDENHPTNPLVSYGITKLGIEKYLYLYERMHGIKSVILRVTNPYGERQRIESGQGAIAVFLHNAHIGKPIEIWGDGNVIRDYIHVNDVAGAFVKAVEYKGPKSIFNISSGVGTSLNDLLTIIEDVLGHPVLRHYLPVRSFDVPVSVLSNELALLEFGWRPSIGIKEGIKRLINSI
jgi:UDP-glucose 4-epimerase